MKKIIAAITLLASIFLVSSCETTVTRSAFFYGGYKITAKVIEEDPANIETAKFIAETIEVALGEDEILFTIIEKWYADQRAKLNMDPIDKEFLHMLVVEPLYNQLRVKYDGTTLKLDDPEIRADILSFRSGMLRALEQFGSIGALGSA